MKQFRNLLTPPLLLLLAGACQPESSEPGLAGEAATAVETAAVQPVEFLNLRGRVPSAWQRETPSSSMRLLQFRVPDGRRPDPAEFVVFYFGPGQGGTAAANIARWRSQFSSATGEPVTPEVTHLSADGMPVTLVSLSGNYARGIGMGAASATPDQTLLAAIVETVDGSIYAQLHGPAATVENQRLGFRAFAASLATVPDSQQ